MSNLALLWKLLIAGLLVVGCHGEDQQSISHLILLDELPSSFNSSATPEIVIRTNFSGTVEFREAERFKVLLNITAPSIEEVYAVTSDLVDHKGRLLLQVYQKASQAPGITLQWIFLVVGSCTGGVMLLTILYTLWWYSSMKYLDVYDNTNYLGNGPMYRSRNSVRLGAGGELLGDEDHHDNEELGEVPEMPEEEEKERIKMEELRVAFPATIPEEAEGESSEEDRTCVKTQYAVPGKSKIRRNLSLKLQDRGDTSSENPYGSAIMDYPDQSGDELENDMSPDQKIADADGNYTPLDDVDDILNQHSSNGSERNFVPDPRGNLDFNIQASKSDGDLVREYHRKMSERNKVIPPSGSGVMHAAKSQNPKLSPRKSSGTDRSHYQRGLNLPTPENDLSKSPVKVMAQVHIPENTQSNQAQYINLMPLELSQTRAQQYQIPRLQQNQMSRLPQSQMSRLPQGQMSRSSQGQVTRSQASSDNNDTLDMYTYPSDIPLMTFKGPATTPTKEPVGRPVPKPKPKPKPIFTGGSPGPFDYGKLEPHFTMEAVSTDPVSPGNFSMLSEGSTSSESDDVDHQEDFFTLDSDEDLAPPVTDGDHLSNASLPLPSPPVMNSPFLPYDTYGAISQLSPRQSLVSPDERGKEYGTTIALTGSPSPGGPFSKHSVNPGKDGNQFVFPPPPMMFTPPQQPSWSRRELFKEEGEYRGPESQNGGPKQGEGRKEDAQARERRQSGGRKGGKPAKYLHLTMLSTICVLSLMTGVYCAVTSQKTQVNIIVFVPPGFPFHQTVLYSPLDKEVEVKDKPESMDWFVAANPVLHNWESSLCEAGQCSQGCDDNTGDCVCRNGYRMTNGVCKDVNECLEAKAKCSHPEAGCVDTEGSYVCFCSGHLYGKETCYECSSPCASGKYEIQPCKGSEGKICKDCTKTCGENYFMKEPCTTYADAVCLMCRPPCNTSAGEYEFTQCSEHQDRVCKVKQELPAPKVSNYYVILDDLSMVREDKVEIIYLPSDFIGARRFVFDRGLTGSGSGFWIEVEVKHLNPIGIFKSVDHSDAMNSSDYPGSPEVPWKYCPYPVPSKYELTYTMHKNVLYQGNTSYGLKDIKPCEGKKSSFPDKKKMNDASVLCAEPNVLSKIFNIDHIHFFKTSTKWLEQSNRCRLSHEACENCSGDCARGMTLSQNECTVNSDDDSGLSPRLPLCYTCCLNRDCDKPCRDYHDNHCQLKRCQNGTLVEFHLKAVYPESSDFYCHVEQVLDQPLIELVYRVKYLYHITLLTRNFSIRSNKVWQETGQVFKRDDIISVNIDGKLDRVPNFIQWAIGAPNVRVGMYKEDGHGIKDTVVGGKSVFIRPRKPFGISPTKFGAKKCQDDLLKDVVISREFEDSYRVMSDLLAMPYQKASYLVTNKTKAPVVHIGINMETSILKAIFNETKLRFDSLAGNLTYNFTHWVLNVTGEVEKCPGFLNLNVTDRNYPEFPLYQFDVGVDCPPRYEQSGPANFSIEFAFPTGDTPDMGKELRVHIRDMSSTYHLSVYSPGLTAADPSGNKPGDDSVEATPAAAAEKPPHFSILFIAAVSGAVLLLLLFLVFGTAWKQGVPEGSILRFRLRHLQMLVVYITFQFAYSIFVSMTVFVLIIIAVNSETAAFLKQYNQQSSVKTALSQLELDQMEGHLNAEIARQTAVAAVRKAQCEQTMNLVVEDFKRLKEQIENSTMDNVKRQSIKNLITSHSQTVLQEFSSKLLSFRDEYSQLEDYTLRKLRSEVDSTYSSILNSTWLRGANYLYGSMALMRHLRNTGAPTKPFMEWLNMDTDMTQLAMGLTLPLPDLPVLHKAHTSSSRLSVVTPKPSHTTPTRASQTRNQLVLLPTGVESESRQQQQKANPPRARLDINSYVPFFIGMMCIDILWLLHRMIKAIGIGRLLLYGYPIYVDVRDKKDGSTVDWKKTETPSHMKIMKEIWKKTFSTFFVPKFIGTVFVCLMVYLVSVCSYNLINRETFSYLGYYNNMEDLMRVNAAVVNSRISSHAMRTNTMEFPLSESMMNSHIQRHQYLLSLAEKQWRSIEEAHSTTYCTYLARINVTASCYGDDQGQGLKEIQVQGCRLSPIVPVMYDRNVSASSKIAEDQMDGFLINIQHLIADTCHIILIYLSAIVIKELLSTVLWIYIKRSGIVSLRIIYETDEMPGTADNSTTNK